MADPVRVVSEYDVLKAITRVKDVFSIHFDRSWLAAVIDDLPMDASVTGDIRNMLSLTELDREGNMTLLHGTESLRKYIWTLRNHLVPRAKELLGVSSFNRTNQKRNRDEKIIRQMTVYTLPHNLDSLTAAALDLENTVIQFLHNMPATGRNTVINTINMTGTARARSAYTRF